MTPSDILRIARAYLGDRSRAAWLAKDGTVYLRLPRGDIWDDIVFDPLNSNDDAFRVQCWLLKWRGKGRRFIELSPWHIGEYYFTDEDQDERITAWTIWHDGTEAGLRRAITEAAKRVTV